MAKWVLGAVLPLFLAACGGGGGSGDSLSGGGGSGGGGSGGPGDPAIGAFVGNNVSAISSSGGSGTIFVSLNLADNFRTGEVSLTQGTGVETITVRRASGTNTYASSSGDVIVTIFDTLNGGPNSSDAAFVEGIDGRGSGNIYFAFSEIPVRADRDSPRASGSARFRGVAVARDQRGRRHSGTIRLDANFNTNRIDGRIRGGFPGEPDAIFNIVPTTIGSSGIFSTTITSSDVSVGDSALRGRGHGRNFDQVSGEYRINGGSAGSVVGLFDAEE